MKKILLLLYFLPLFSLAQGPTAFFSPSNIIGCCDDFLYFTDMSTIGTSPIIIWSWIMGGSGTYFNGPNSSSQHVEYAYSNPGTYPVNLTVTDANGLSDTFTGTATICCVTAGFTVTSPICLGDSAHFTDLSSIYPPSPFGAS